MRVSNGSGGEDMNDSGSRGHIRVSVSQFHSLTSY